MFLGFFTLFCFLFLFSYFEVYSSSEHQGTPEKSNLTKSRKLTPERLFKVAFMEKRFHQKQAMKSILKFDNYEKQYKITKTALEKIFEVVRTSRAILENSDYIPGIDFPTNETILSELGQMVENAALFGEFQLKLPDITDRIMKFHPESLEMMKWAIGFSNLTGIFDKSTGQMINLLGQEMNLIDREENFINPYRKYDTDILKQKNSVPPKRKIIKKGPRMSKVTHQEL